MCARSAWNASFFWPFQAFIHLTNFYLLYRILVKIRYKTHHPLPTPRHLSTPTAVLQQTPLTHTYDLTTAIATPPHSRKARRMSEKPTECSHGPPHARQARSVHASRCRHLVHSCLKETGKTLITGGVDVDIGKTWVRRYVSFLLTQN
jgi:hypothetical protein